MTAGASYLGNLAGGPYDLGLHLFLQQENMAPDVVHVASCHATQYSYMSTAIPASSVVGTMSQRQHAVAFRVPRGRVRHDATGLAERNNVAPMLAVYGSCRAAAAAGRGECWLHRHEYALILANMEEYRTSPGLGESHSFKLAVPDSNALVLSLHDRYNNTQRSSDTERFELWRS